MNNTSVIGAGFMLVVGVGLLAGALVGVLRRHHVDRPAGGLAIAIDVLVGGVALTDAAISVSGGPGRVALWTAGSAALVVVGGLVVLHRRRSGRGTPSGGDAV